ncbi:MAG: hypothetical protein IJR85_09335 [Synergistaceae bacterium]|nr:hypothetical protein [Synergistaceae bacterium]
MRKFLVIVMVLVLVLAGSASARPRIAVRAFEDRSEEGKAPAAAIMDMMVTELNKAGVFDLMERERLDYIADEIKLGQSGLMDPSTAPKVGKIKGVQYTMTGAITLYYYAEKGSGFALPVLGMATQAKTAYVVLDIRIIDNSTGEIVYTADQVGEAKQVAKGAIAAYKGFFIGSYNRTTGGLLATAARDSVMKHVAAIKAQEWEE